MGQTFTPEQEQQVAQQAARIQAAKKARALSLSPFPAQINLSGLSTTPLLAPPRPFSSLADAAAPQMQTITGPQSSPQFQPPPIYPNLQLLLSQQQGYNEQAAGLMPSLYDLQSAQAQAQQQGAMAHLNALSAPDPTQMRYNPPAYNPQELPTHEQIAIPQRGYTAPDPTASLLAGVAGLFDPAAASHYAAAPLEAAHAYASQAYQDALNRYNMASQQADSMYHDRLAQVQQANQAQSYNQSAALQGNIRLGADQGQYETQKAGLLGTQAADSSLIGQMGGLSGKQSQAQVLQAKAQGIAQQIALREHEYAEAERVWQVTGSQQAQAAKLLAQQQLATLRLQEQVYAAQLRSATSMYGVDARTDENGQPIGRYGALGVRPMTENEMGNEYWKYMTNRTIPLPSGMNPRLRAMVQEGRANAPEETLDPDEQAKFTGDQFDVRVKGPYTAWKKIHDDNISLTQDQRAAFDTNIWSGKGKDPDGMKSVLTKQYALEKAKGLVPDGQNLHNWAQERWISINESGKILGEAAQREQEAKAVLDAAVERIHAPRKAPTPIPVGANSATMSGGAGGKPVLTPPTGPIISGPGYSLK